MINECEGQPPFYHLFNQCYGGGNWNAALIAEADVQRRRAEKAEGEVAQLKTVAEAARNYCRAFKMYRAMAIANPKHAAIPALSEHLDDARERLFMVGRS